MNNTTLADIIENDELMGGKLHGPKNEAGLTRREEQELWDEYYSELADLQREWMT
jgi:hypothetical protein